VHTSLFFIILGLGVDDIFVIMASFRKINEEQQALSLEEKIAKTMQKAGASITVTSLTDFIAFAVGATTILPSLRSFCVFAAVCILLTYGYVVTFFVAVLTIDEKRAMQNRNGIIPCIKHANRTPSCEPRLMWRSLHFLYGKVLLTKVGKVVVLLGVVALTTFSIDRALQIQQYSDLLWFIPKNTYFYEFYTKYRIYYPEKGYEAGVYMGNMNYTLELPKVIAMAQEVEKRSDLISQVQSWPTAFKNFMMDLEDINVMEVNLNNTQWNDYLSKFLFSIDGGRYQQNIKFKEKIECGKPAGDILISSITFNFHKFFYRDQFLPAKAAIEDIIRNANFTTGETFVWGRILGSWFTDEIIDQEIYRNILLALIGVFICTAVLIVNMQVCLYIFICVLLSLVSVGGFMQVWGLTLDIVTSIGLQLSVGLCIGECDMF
jgi:Niemann-Pick C1 protein